AGAPAKVKVKKAEKTAVQKALKQVSVEKAKPVRAGFSAVSGGGNARLIVLVTVLGVMTLAAVALAVARRRGGASRWLQCPVRGTTLCRIAPPDVAGASGQPRRHRVGRLSALFFPSLVLERVFSLGLIAVVAAVYGVTASTDAYFRALIVPAALGYSLTEAIYTAILPFFGGPHGATRRRLAAAMGVGVPLALVAGGGYAAIVVLVQPDNLAVWLAFARLVPAQPIAGVYAAYFTAQRRYALATLRVPFITGVAFVSALVLLSFWGSITAIAVAYSLGFCGQLVLLAVLAKRLPAER